MIKFEVEGKPVSLNQIYTKHWTKRSQDKQILWWKIKTSLIKAKISHQALDRSVEIQFIFNVKRQIDVDNCAGTVKMIIDYLREWGLLKNDSPEFVKKISIEVRQSMKELVEITII